MNIKYTDLDKIVKSVGEKFYPDIEIQANPYYNKSAICITAHIYDPETKMQFAAQQDVTSLEIVDKTENYIIGMLESIIKYLVQSVQMAKEKWKMEELAKKYDKVPLTANTKPITYEDLQKAYESAVIGNAPMFQPKVYSTSSAGSYWTTTHDKEPMKPAHSLSEMYAAEAAKPKKSKKKAKQLSAAEQVAAQANDKLKSLKAEAMAETFAEMVEVTKKAMVQEISYDFFKPSPLLSYLEGTSGGSSKLNPAPKATPAEAQNQMNLTTSKKIK